MDDTVNVSGPGASGMVYGTGDTTTVSGGAFVTDNGTGNTDNVSDSGSVATISGSDTTATVSGGASVTDNGTGNSDNAWLRLAGLGLRDPATP